MRQVNNAACTPKLKNALVLLKKNLNASSFVKPIVNQKDNIKMNLTNQWITSVRGFKSSSSPTQ
jgi:uncharacterized UPF0146 family protein